MLVMSRVCGTFYSGTQFSDMFGQCVCLFGTLFSDMFGQGVYSVIYVGSCRVRCLTVKNDSPQCHLNTWAFKIFKFLVLSRKRKNNMLHKMRYRNGFPPDFLSFRGLFCCFFCP